MTEFDPIHGYAYRTFSKSALGMDGRVTVTPEGADSARVDYLIEVRPHGLLRLIEPLLRSEISRNEAAELTRMKEQLEGTASGALRDAAAQ